MEFDEGGISTVSGAHERSRRHTRVIQIANSANSALCDRQSDRSEGQTDQPIAQKHVASECETADKSSTEKRLEPPMHSSSVVERPRWKCGDVVEARAENCGKAVGHEICTICESLPNDMYRIRFDSEPLGRVHEVSGANIQAVGAGLGKRSARGSSSAVSFKRKAAARATGDEDPKQSRLKRESKGKSKVVKTTEKQQQTLRPEPSNKSSAVNHADKSRSQRSASSSDSVVTAMPKHQPHQRPVSTVASPSTRSLLRGASPDGWTADESKRLQQLVEAEGPESWTIIARKLGTRRTASACKSHHATLLRLQAAKKNKSLGCSTVEKPGLSDVPCAELAPAHEVGTEPLHQDGDESRQDNQNKHTLSSAPQAEPSLDEVRQAC
eukprot:SAG31_NODE_1513_length_8045_cov_5.748804_10_plen_383_part_00